MKAIFSSSLHDESKKSELISIKMLRAFSLIKLKKREKCL